MAAPAFSQGGSWQARQNYSIEASKLQIDNGSPQNLKTQKQLSTVKNYVSLLKEKISLLEKIFSLLEKKISLLENYFSLLEKIFSSKEK